MALPSASRARTGRSGQASAAPVASGRPWPIAPPVRVSQSCGGAPAVAAGSAQPRGVRLVADDRVLRQQRADDRGRAVPGQVAVRQGRALRRPRADAAPVRCGRDEVGQRRERARDVVARPGQHVHVAACPAPASWACPGRRRRTPGPAPRPGSGGACRRAARRPSRPGTRAGRPAGCPRRARAGPGTSRRAAGRRWPGRSGWPPRARAGASRCRRAGSRRARRRGAPLPPHSITSSGDRGPRAGPVSPRPARRRRTRTRRRAG